MLPVVWRHDGEKHRSEPACFSSSARRKSASLAKGPSPGRSRPRRARCTASQRSAVCDSASSGSSITCLPCIERRGAGKRDGFPMGEGLRISGTDSAYQPSNSRVSGGARRVTVRILHISHRFRTAKLAAFTVSAPCKGCNGALGLVFAERTERGGTRVCTAFWAIC